MELEELERKYKELGEELERIKSKPGEFWHITESDTDTNMAFVVKHHSSDELDECREIYTRQSNAFPTELEAARMAERFNLELEISKFIKDNHGEVDWDDGNPKYYIVYDHEDCKFVITVYHTYQNNDFYFNRRTLASEAIEIYGNRLKFAWGITDER